MNIGYKMKQDAKKAAVFGAAAALLGLSILPGCANSAATPKYMPTPTPTPVYEKAPVIFNMNDMQNDWLEDVAINLTELHIEKNVDMVNGVIPYGMDGSLIPALQDWYTNHGDVIEIAQEGYKHSSNDYEPRYLQKGLEEFQRFGMKPTCFIPPYAKVVRNTTEDLAKLGFHTLMSNASLDVNRNTSVLVMDDGIWLDKNPGTLGELKSIEELMREIDTTVENNGLAIVSYYMHDFSKGGETMNQEKYNKFSSILDALKNSGKYEFMTAEEYYHLYFNGLEPTTTTTPGKGVVIFNMDDMQSGWLEDISIALTELHRKKNVDMVNGVIPYGIDGLLLEKLKDWYANDSDVIEIAEHGYKHSETDYEPYYIQKGLEGFQRLGMEPTCFIPPCGEVVQNTPKDLEELGFHVLLCGVKLDVNPEPNITIIDDAVWLCQDGMNGADCKLKSTDDLIAEIDDSIESKGYVLITYHMQDFSTNGCSMDQDKYNQFSDTLDELRDSGKYQFMTAEEYFIKR